MIKLFILENEVPQLLVLVELCLLGLKLRYVHLSEVDWVELLPLFDQFGPIFNCIILNFGTWLLLQFLPCNKRIPAYRIFVVFYHQLPSQWTPFHTKLLELLLVGDWNDGHESLVGWCSHVWRRSSELRHGFLFGGLCVDELLVYIGRFYAFEVR